MDKQKYLELLDVLRNRYVHGEIDRDTYNQIKADLEQEYNSSIADNNSQISTQYISDFKQGDIVSHRYKILEKLGEGGMATVYLAENISIGKKVAIKKMLPALMSDSDLIERFRKEAISLLRQKPHRPNNTSHSAIFSSYRHSSNTYNHPHKSFCSFASTP